MKIPKPEPTPESALALVPKSTIQTLNGYIVEIETRLRNIKCDFFEIGRYLSKAKAILPHGTFQLWIEKHFNKELPYSTAALYMKIFETFENSPKSVQYLPVTFLMKMTQKDFPEAIFNIVCENAQTERLDIKEIKEAYTLYKGGQINLTEFENAAKKQIELAVAIEKGNTQKRIGDQMIYNVRTGVGSLLSAARRLRKNLRRMHYFVNPGEDKYLIQDIDLAISELQQTKEMVLHGEELYRNGVINEKTGERGLLLNEHLIETSNN